jgi:hypothetical protein
MEYRLFAMSIPASDTPNGEDHYLHSLKEFSNYISEVMKAYKWRPQGGVSINYRSDTTMTGKILGKGADRLTEVDDSIYEITQAMYIE